MPYSIKMDGNGKHCIVKNSDGKKMGCHPSHEAAMKQMAALYANEAMSTTVLWIDPFAYVEGRPFRVFPIGSFKRGERTIDLTEQRLRDMEQNYNAKRPRWEIPIYFGHPTDTQPDPPKGGNIKRLELRPGDGLYAYPDYTDTAKKSVENGEYQYVSPGVLWSIGGSVYADENGNEFDNVIDHIALTNRPFFGNRTAIFSSEESIMKETDAFVQFKEWFAELFRDFNTEERKKTAKTGAAMPDGSYPIENEGDLSNAIHAIGRGNAPHASIRAHIIKRARALGKTSMLPEDWKVNADADTKEPDKMPAHEMMKGKSNMADPTVITDTFDAKAKVDELTAQLGKQADEFKAQLAKQADEATAEKKRADEFAVQLSNERKTRRLNELHQVGDTYSALPIKSDEFAEKFYALEQVNPDLAKWFNEKFAQFNTDMATGDLFSQISRRDARRAEVETVETFAMKLMAEETKQDKSKFSYTEALLEAAKRKPMLAEKHLASSKSVTE